MAETVKDNCLHSDCKYRGYFGGEACCTYMLVTERPRGSKISECDKYDAGKLKWISTLGGLMHVDEDG